MLKKTIKIITIIFILISFFTLLMIFEEAEDTSDDNSQDDTAMALNMVEKKPLVMGFISSLYLS